MHTLSKNSHGEGFREVDVIHEIEYVGEKTTDELVMDALAKHPMAVFQIAKELQISDKTIDSAVRRLWMAGVITRKPLVVRIDGRRRNVIEYRIVKK